MRRTALIAGILALGPALAACGVGGDGAPRFTAPVVDAAGVIDDAVEQNLNSKLEQFRVAVGPQIAVLVVDSTGNTSIEDYGIDIAREWGIGDKQRDDGVLLLIALDDRTLRIETGSGIEGDLTDVEAGRVIDGVVVPQLRNNDPTAAVVNGVEALVTELSGQSYEFPEEAPATSTTTATQEVGLAGAIFGFFVILMFGLGVVGMMVRGRRRGLGALDVLSLLYIFTSSSRGGFGGGRGLGGFGGGGGGGFSGGGASGSW